MNQQLSKCRIRRFYADHTSQELEDDISAEVQLSIEVNGVVQTRLFCSPHSLSELVTGYIFVEYGIVTTHFSIEPMGGTSCYRASCYVDEGSRQSNSSWHMDVPPDEMMEMEKKLLSESDTFKATGNIHVSALCREKQICYISEDISRHNTLYRVIGMCAGDGKKPGSYYLCTSGRLPYSMAAVAIKAGISVLISRSAPTDLSLELAKQHGLTLAGFASEKHVNLYMVHGKRAEKTIGLVILSGGKASRMGGTDKSGLILGHQTFLEKLAGELSFLDEKLLSVNETGQGTMDGFLAVFDEAKGIGAMGGICAALKKCKSDALLVVACDTPLFTKKYAEMAIGSFDDCDACLFQIGDKLQPLNGIYGKSCISLLETCMENKQYRLIDALSQLRVKTILISENEHFLNVNTPEDYKKVKEAYEKSKII